MKVQELPKEHKASTVMAEKKQFDSIQCKGYEAYTT